MQMEIATVRNVKYYRAMAGPFKNQQAAVGAQKKIKDSKVSLSTPFTKTGVITESVFVLPKRLVWRVSLVISVNYSFFLLKSR